MKTHLAKFIDKYWLYSLIAIIFVIPPVLNWLLPKWNFSNIGGKDSLVVWLNFLASYINSLIFCAVTIIVLYKQIRSNNSENNQNRIANKQENALNREDNNIQNERNREINLKTIQYNNQLSQLSNIIPIFAKYVSLFDFSDIKILKREWRSHIQTREYCLTNLTERTQRTKDICYTYLLTLQSCDNIEDNFIDTQKNHIKRLFELLSMLKLYFCCDVSDFHSEEGRIKIIEHLNSNELDIKFTKESDPFFQIEYEFSELGLNSIQLEIEIFITNQKKKISNILYG